MKSNGPGKARCFTAYPPVGVRRGGGFRGSRAIFEHRGHTFYPARIPTVPVPWPRLEFLSPFPMANIGLTSCFSVVAGIEMHDHYGARLALTASRDQGAVWGWERSRSRAIKLQSRYQSYNRDMGSGARAAARMQLWSDRGLTGLAAQQISKRPGCRMRQVGCASNPGARGEPE